MPTCKLCGEWMPYESHVCPPTWDIWIRGEDRADCRHVVGSTALDAAERWAARDDQQGDYSIVGGSPQIVYVSLHGSEDVELVRVMGETVPRYTAEALDKEYIRIVDLWNQNYPVGTIVRFEGLTFSKGNFEKGTFEGVTESEACISEESGVPEVTIKVLDGDKERFRGVQLSRVTEANGTPPKTPVKKGQ